MLGIRTAIKVGDSISAPAIAVSRKYFAMHAAMTGQVLLQSGVAGFSSGQHGMSSAMLVIAL